jgi:RNA polymerase sigma factor (sigma-70 family)
MSRPKHTFQNVLNYLTQRSRCREDAEDLVQEAWTRLIEYSRTGKVENDAAFVWQTARHLLIDQYRRRKRHPVINASLEQLELTLPFLKADPTPDEVLVVEQRLIQLRDGLIAYSRRTADIYMAHRAGFSYKEIAAAYGISDSAVGKHIKRAVVWLMDHKDTE